MLFIEGKGLIWLHIWIWFDWLLGNLLYNKPDEQEDTVC
jgi:hypothetical protein